VNVVSKEGVISKVVMQASLTDTILTLDNDGALVTYCLDELCNLFE
jgi:hypothetical protein